MRPSAAAAGIIRKRSTKPSRRGSADANGPHRKWRAIAGVGEKLKKGRNEIVSALFDSSAHLILGFDVFCRGNRKTPFHRLTHRLKLGTRCQTLQPVISISKAPAISAISAVIRPAMAGSCVGGGF